MSTVFDAITDTVRAALLSGSPLAGGRVHEGLDLTEIPADQTDALVITLGRALCSQPYAGTGAPVEWRIPVRLTAFVRHNDRTAAGRPAYLLAQDAHARVMASALAPDVQDYSLQPDAEVASTRAGAVDIVYTLRAFTGAADLTAA